MKASTLLSVTVALFLGLAVAVGAKYSGFFSPKPPPPPPQPKPKPKVLVAAKNLFDGYTILQGDVNVRDMTEEEEADYREHKDKYLPPKPEVAILRVLNRSVEADQPILRDYLDDINLPQAIHRRLSSPTMRAVNVTVPPERAAGGLIQRGEYVDVYLTTRIFVLGRRRSTSMTETAAIARNLKVIVKRNMLWDAVVPLDPNKPIEFTLEANVYRAALIEYAKTKGQLTLVPTATPKDPKGKPAFVSAGQNDLNSKEYQNEDERVEAFLRGEYAVSDADLERIFNLKPPNSPSYSKPIEIEQYTGNRFRGVQSFDTNKGKGISDGVINPNTGQPINYAFGPLDSKGPNIYGDDYNDYYNNNNPFQHPLTLRPPRNAADTTTNNR
jgi:Flp pilus assembly protein CpaB